MARMGSGTIRESRAVRYGGVEIPFTLIKSSRKTYAVSVNQNGEVFLRTPLFASEHMISRILTERKSWLISHYEEALSKKKEREANRLTPEAEAALERACRTAAKEWIPKRAAHYLPMTGGHYEKIVIRGQKTRWGSCSGRGTLSFHWKLMLAPPEVLDYVVVHELCHLLHMDHSAAFWAAVEGVLPDYRRPRKWLKEHGEELFTLFLEKLN